MIRKFAALAGILFLLPSLGLPQAIPCSQIPIPCERLKLREVEYQALLNLEKENARAIQLNNSTFFQSAYADEFAGTTSYGMAITKSELIHIIQTSSEKFQTVIASDIQVKMYLDSASVLSMRTEHGRLNGNEVSRQFRVLRVYIYSPRGWKVVSQLETQLPGHTGR